MSKGKTKVKYFGGSLDGESFEDVALRFLVGIVTHRTGFWFRETDDQAQLVKGGKLDEYWHSYEIDVYEKANKDQDGYFIYKYIRSEYIERCSALTKTGKRCMKHCYKDLPFCTTHKKAAKSA